MSSQKLKTVRATINVFSVPAKRTTHVVTASASADVVVLLGPDRDVPHAVPLLVEAREEPVDPADVARGRLFPVRPALLRRAEGREVRVPGHHQLHVPLRVDVPGEAGHLEKHGERHFRTLLVYVECTDTF